MGQSSLWTRVVYYRGEREEGQFSVQEAIWGSLASGGGNMGQSSQGGGEVSRAASSICLPHCATLPYFTPLQPPGHRVCESISPCTCVLLLCATLPVPYFTPVQPRPLCV